MGAAAGDRRSGSAAIARAAADAIASLPADEARRAARVLVEGQPVMAACLRLADAVVRAGDTAGAARAFAAQLDAEAAALPMALDVFLPRGSTVVTVSSSSAVVAALARPSHGATVLCAASGPEGEGVQAARALRDAGVDAEVIPDAAVAGAAARAQLVVLGADAVGPGAVLNKTGSLAAVLGARLGSGDRIVLAGTSKFVDARGWHAIEQAAAGRASFEAVPLRLLSVVVTEDGPLSPPSARRLAARSKLDPKVLEWIA